MKNSWLLISLAPLLLLLAVSSSSLPLTGAASSSASLRLRSAGQHVRCVVGDGVYASNSTYQANLRRVAALLTGHSRGTAAGRSYVSHYSTHTVGYWPNRVMARTLCRPQRRRRRYVNGTVVVGGYQPCADCIAGAFLEVERACPYRREAFFSNGNCTLELAEIRIFGGRRGTGGFFLSDGNILKQVMASGLVFQAIGFGWLFFLLFQEWRSRKRGTSMNSTPLLSGD